MAHVTCPDCGEQRVVAEGKKKSCRRCGRGLTADMGAGCPNCGDKRVEIEGKKRKCMGCGKVRTADEKPKRTAGSEQEKRKQLSEEIEALTGQVERLTAENEELRGELDELRGHLEDVAAEDGSKEDENEAVDLESMTVTELRAYAHDNDLVLRVSNVPRPMIIEAIKTQMAEKE